MNCLINTTMEKCRIDLTDAEVEEPEKENEEIESEQFQFTLEQLIASGWKNATEDDLYKLNNAMDQFKVTSRESAYMMLATMYAESSTGISKSHGR